MKKTIPITLKLLIFVSIFFILAIANSWLFLNSIKEFKKYAEINNVLFSIKTDIVALEYMLDVFVIGGDFEKGGGTEGVNLKAKVVDSDMERLKELSAAFGIFNDNPMLSRDYNDIVSDWRLVKERIAVLSNAISREEGLLVHNDVDLTTFLIAERLAGIEKFIYTEKDMAFSDITVLVGKSLLISALVAIAGIYLFYRNVINPIIRMSSAAEKIIDGNLSSRFETASKDEIGVLAKLLNKMADTINEAHSALGKNILEKTMIKETRTTEFTALNKVVGTIGRTLSKEEIALIAIDELIHSINADAGWIYLTEPFNTGPEKRTGLIVQRGLPHTFLKEANDAKLEEYLTGRLRNNKKHIFVNISEMDNSSRPLLESMGFKALCIIPIVYTESTIGAIILASKSQDGFSNTASCLFAEIMSGELAIAIENINLFEKEYRSKQLLERIIYQSPVSIAVFDKCGTCIMFNPAYSNFFEIKDGSQPVGKYNLFEDEVLETKGYTPLIKMRIFEGKPVTIEFEHDVSKSRYNQITRKPIKLKTTLSPIVDSNGSVINIVAMYEDVTEEDNPKKQMSKT